MASPIAQTAPDKTIVQRVYEHILTLPKDAEFSSKSISDAIGEGSNPVSAGLSYLRKKGCIEAICRTGRVFVYKLIEEKEFDWKNPSLVKLTRARGGLSKVYHKLQLPLRSDPETSTPETETSTPEIQEPATEPLPLHEQLLTIAVALEQQYLNPDLSRVSTERLIEELRRRKVAFLK